MIGCKLFETQMRKPRPRASMFFILCTRVGLTDQLKAVMGIAVKEAAPTSMHTPIHTDTPASFSEQALIPASLRRTGLGEDQ